MPKATERLTKRQSGRLTKRQALPQAVPQIKVGEPIPAEKQDWILPDGTIDYGNMPWPHVIRKGLNKLPKDSGRVIRENAEMLKNWKGTAALLGKMGGQAAWKPFSMLQPEKLLYGFLRMSSPGALPAVPDRTFEEANRKNTELFDLLIQIYANNYDLSDNQAGIKRYIAEEPADFLADAGTVATFLLSRGGAAGLRAGGGLAKLLPKFKKSLRFNTYYNDKLARTADKVTDVATKAYYLGTGRKRNAYQPGAWAKLARHFLEYSDVGGAPLVAGGQGLSLGIASIVQNTTEANRHSEVARYLYNKYKRTVPPDLFARENLENIAQLIRKVDPYVLERGQVPTHRQISMWDNSEEIIYVADDPYTGREIVPEPDYERDYDTNNTQKISIEDVEAELADLDSGSDTADDELLSGLGRLFDEIDEQYPDDVEPPIRVARSASEPTRDVGDESRNILRQTIADADTAAAQMQDVGDESGDVLREIIAEANIRSTAANISRSGVENINTPVGIHTRLYDIRNMRSLRPDQRIYVVEVNVEADANMPLEDRFTILGDFQVQDTVDFPRPITDWNSESSRYLESKVQQYPTPEAMIAHFERLGNPAEMMERIGARTPNDAHRIIDNFFDMRTSRENQNYNIEMQERDALENLAREAINEEARDLQQAAKETLGNELQSIGTPQLASETEVFNLRNRKLMNRIRSNYRNINRVPLMVESTHIPYKNLIQALDGIDTNGLSDELQAILEPLTEQSEILQEFYNIRQKARGAIQRRHFFGEQEGYDPGRRRRATLRLEDKVAEPSLRQIGEQFSETLYPLQEQLNQNFNMSLDSYSQLETKLKELADTGDVNAQKLLNGLYKDFNSALQSDSKIGFIRQFKKEIPHEYQELVNNHLDDIFAEYERRMNDATHINEYLADNRDSIISETEEFKRTLQEQIAYEEEGTLDSIREDRMNRGEGEEYIESLHNGKHPLSRTLEMTDALLNVLNETNIENRFTLIRDFMKREATPQDLRVIGNYPNEFLFYENVNDRDINSRLHNMAESFHETLTTFQDNVPRQDYQGRHSTLHSIIWDSENNLADVMGEEMANAGMLNYLVDKTMQEYALDEIVAEGVANTLDDWRLKKYKDKLAQEYREDFASEVVTILGTDSWETITNELSELHRNKKRAAEDIATAIESDAMFDRSRLPQFGNMVNRFIEQGESELGQEIGQILIDPERISNEQLMQALSKHPQIEIRREALNSLFADNSLKSLTTNIIKAGPERLQILFGDQVTEEVQKLANYLNSLDLKNLDNLPTDTSLRLFESNIVNGDFRFPAMFELMGETDDLIGQALVLFMVLGNENTLDMLNRRGAIDRIKRTINDKWEKMDKDWGEYERKWEEVFGPFRDEIQREVKMKKIVDWLLKYRKALREVGMPAGRKIEKEKKNEKNDDTRGINLYNAQPDNQRQFFAH